MTQRQANGAVEWQRPGPGTWDLDASHAPPAPGPIVRRLFAETMRVGTAAGMREYGAPLAGLDVAWVNGKYYLRLVPLVGANRDEGGRQPPAVVMRLFARLHPAFRRCERRAEETFRIKRWRDDLERWQREWKPALVATNTRLTELEVDAVPDTELAAHLCAVDRHLHGSLTLHQRLGSTILAPLGNLMVHLEDWGLDPVDALRAVAGASPATGDPAERQRTIAAAIAEAPVPSAPRTLDDIRAASLKASALLDEYLRDHGWRLTTGYDLEDRCLIELPETIVASILSAGVAPVVRPAGAADAELAVLRDEVPVQHRALFDELVADARGSYGLRDEDGPLTYEWPAGLLRRALLECGKRLTQRRRLVEPLDVFELDVPEIAGLLTDGSGPDLDTIAARAAERRHWATLEAPRRLGPDPVDPPPDVLPANIDRLVRAVTLLMRHTEADPAHQGLRGTGVGTDAITGRALVVHDPDVALRSMQPGDIVVARYTTPTYNAVLTMAGGLVTAEGGPMAHAGIIALELGLPAVVGAPGAMEQIVDGSTITVDPRAGLVTVVASIDR